MSKWLALSLVLQDGETKLALSQDTVLGGVQNSTVQMCKASPWHVRHGREQESDSRWCHPL